MADEKGWIKIHRSIFRNPWMLRPNVLAVWMYILGRVKWRPTDVVFEGKRITLQPGQGLFKLREIAADLRISRGTLFRVIDVLKTETQIETQTSPRNTVITVVNWEKYQLAGTQNGTQAGHKRDTNGTPTYYRRRRRRGRRGRNTRAIRPAFQCFSHCKRIAAASGKIPRLAAKN